MQPTITLTEATRQVDTALQAAFAHLPPGGQLRRTAAYGSLPCEGAGGADGGQVFADLEYQVVTPDPWPVEQVFPALDQFWRGQGYRITRDERTAPDIAVLAVRNPSGDVKLSVKLYHQADGSTDVYLLGSSGCVWEHGTPPADT